MSDSNDAPGAEVVPLHGPRGRRTGGRRGDRELRAALRGLRREIDERFPIAGAPEPVRADDAFDWVTLFDELRHRLGNAGVAERSGEVDEFGLDVLTLIRMQAALDFLIDRWWRVDLAGVELLPESGPVLFVANRSGLFPGTGSCSHTACSASGHRGRARGSSWRTG